MADCVLVWPCQSEKKRHPACSDFSDHLQALQELACKQAQTPFRADLHAGLAS